MGKRIYEIRPLTDERWDDLEDLFGANGACGGCWCMYWRIPRKEYNAQKGEMNKKAFREIVKDNVIPGLIAYDGDLAVGWIAVQPREDYPGLERSRILKPVDEKAVWSVTCFFTRKEYRRKGVSHALIEAAKEHVGKSGGKILEAYPVDSKNPNAPAPFVWTGLASAFRNAGFEEVARRSETRPVLRYNV